METFCAAEIASQKSPSTTVYVRTQAVAAAAKFSKRKESSVLGVPRLRNGELLTCDKSSKDQGNDLREHVMGMDRKDGGSKEW